ncbi:MAG TPA: hypothetical protein VII98_15270 [Solirubrobacteraceae bacterium]
MTLRTFPVALALVSMLAALLLLSHAGSASGMASHAGWPRIDGVLWINKLDHERTKHGTHRSDELLGGHGSDTIMGGRRADVIWGDFKPSGQPTTQVDRLYGGAGNDFIYASHGWNRVEGGPGDDVIHAHFGHGIIDCGPGRDVVYLSHRGRNSWKLRGCEVVDYRTEAQRGL